MSTNAHRNNGASPRKNKRFIAFSVLGLVALIVIALIVFFNVRDNDDTPKAVESPTAFVQPGPEEYEKPTDLPEAPGEESDGGGEGPVKNEDGSKVGPPVQESSSEEEKARKSAQDSLVEWGKQDSEEKPKDRVKRMKKISSKGSVIAEEAPLFIDEWGGGDDKKGDDHAHDHDNEGTTASTVKVDAMSYENSNGSTQITYNAILSVTVHEEFVGEKFDREPYDFKVSITMKKQGNEWKADMIVPAAY